MTELSAEQLHEAAAEQAATPQRVQRRMAPIVPAQNIAGRALVLVIAIMTFLSCLTFGAVTLDALRRTCLLRGRFMQLFGG